MINKLIFSVLFACLLLVNQAVGQSSDWYVMTHEGDTIKKISASSLKPGGEFLEIKKAGKYGYIDYAGRTLIKTQFDEVKGYAKGVACVKHLEKYGFMDEKGRMVIGARYEDADGFQDNVARVELGHKWGYIDASGKVIVQFKYEDASNFSEGLAMVRKTYDRTWAMINKEGEVVVENKYQALVPPTDGLIPNKLEGRWGYLDLEGNVVIENQYKLAYGFNEGLAFAGSDYEFGVIDKEGNMLGKPIYEKIKHPGFQEGHAPVRIRGKWGFINKENEVVVEPAYEDAGHFSMGLAPVKKENLWGYIDNTGELVIPFQYEAAYPITKVRGRPVIVVKGAPMAPIVLEPEVEEEEETEEDAEDETEEGTEETTEENDNEASTEEEEIADTKTPDEIEGTKTEIKETKAPKEIAEQQKEETPKEPIAPATDEDYLAFFDVLSEIVDDIDAAMKTSKTSNKLMEEAHDSGQLDVYAENSEAATKELSDASASLNACKEKIKAAKSTANNLKKCTSLSHLLKTSNNKIIAAETLIEKAETHLAKAFKEEEYDAYQAEINKLNKQLDDAASSIETVNYSLEVCLGMD